MVASYEIEIKGLKELTMRLEAAVKDDVIRKALSKGTVLLAQWSIKNRFATINPNRKQVLSDKLTARTAGGYRDRIFGQSPSEITKSGDAYIAKFGTNITSRGFSYPRLHEYGGIFHRPRPVLTPSIENTQNRQQVIDILVSDINKALEEK